MCIKSSPQREGSEYRVIPICQITLGGDKTKNKQNVGYLGAYSPPFGGGAKGEGPVASFLYTYLIPKNYDTKHCTQHFTQRQ